MSRFVKDVTQTSWCVFSVHSSNCCSLAKRECEFSHGRVETLFRWGGKRLHFCTTNLLRTIRTKFYHYRSGFVDYISKNILVCFFGSQCMSAYIRITWSSDNFVCVICFFIFLRFGVFILLTIRHRLCDIVDQEIVKVTKLQHNMRDRKINCMMSLRQTWKKPQNCRPIAINANR